MVFDAHAQSQTTSANAALRSSSVLSALLPNQDARSSMILAAYAEYERLRNTGVEVDPEQFCKEHPSLGSALHQLIGIQQFAEDRLQCDGARRLPEAGDTFADCHLLEKLGEGSFAQVFRAELLTLGNRQAVVKISACADLEAQIQGPLAHPNIVPANWVVQVEGTDLAAIVMPYLGRATLQHILSSVQAQQNASNKPAADLAHTPAMGRPRPGFIADLIRDPELAMDEPPLLLQRGTYFDAVCCLGEQMARGLAYLHGRNIQHRDLKPSNVLVTPAGQAMLMDFNLSADAALGNVLFGGTLLYMSPQQLQGFRIPPWEERPALDNRTDVYSLGVILYELLTGQHPFRAEPLPTETAEMLAELLRRQAQRPRPLRQLLPNGNPQILNLIERCLAFNPEDRPSSAAAVADILAAHVKVRQRILEPRTARARRLVVASCLAATVAVAATVFAIRGNSAAFLAGQPQNTPGPQQGDAAKGGNGGVPEIDHYEKGKQAYKNRKFDEAVDHFSKIIAANSDDLRAWFAQGRAYQQWSEQGADHFDKAITCYQHCQKNQVQPEIEACLGYCLQRNKQPSAAHESYEKATNSGFKCAAVFNNLGWYHRESNNQVGSAERQKLAIENFDEAIKLDAELSSAFYGRASIALNKAIMLQSGAAKDPLKAKEFAETVEFGKADIQQALKELKAGNVYKDAALLFALTSPASEDSRQWTCKYLEKANEHQFGIDEIVSRSGSIFHPFTTYGEFQSLSVLPVGNLNPKKAQVLLDPLHGELELP